MNRTVRALTRFTLAAAALVGGLSTLAAHADMIINSNNYCSAGSNPTKTSDTVAGSLLSVNDVTLATAASVQRSSDCYGAFDPGNSSPTNEVNAVNEIFGPGFTFLDKTGGASNAAGLGGLKWEIHSLGGSNGNPGLWSISWTALNPSAWSDLPLTIDLAVLLVGGNQSAAYLLTGVLIPSGPNWGIGTFDIQFFNGSAAKCGYKDNDYGHDDGWNKGYGKDKDKGKGKDHNKGKDKDKHHDKECKPQQPSISHITLAGRLTPTIEVPEPASMALFGAGALGLLMFRRREKAQA